MARTMMTRDGDVADLIALTAYGVTSGATEALIAANPTLRDRGPVLPAGLTLTLPDVELAPLAPAVSLWD